MSGRSVEVLGIFAHLDAFTRAIRSLRSSGYRDITAFSPVPRHEIEDALQAGRSPVRFFALGGGLMGCLTGFVLTISTSLHYPLMTGGKPIISIPPFLVIVFELTILFGALGTILGMLLSIQLPRLSLEPGYDPRFSVDRFGLWLRCSQEHGEAVEVILRSSGAEEVHLEEDLPH